MNIQWKHIGPGEEKALYKNMRLRKKKVAGKMTYFIYKGDDHTPEFTTSYYPQFMQRVQAIASDYDHNMPAIEYFGTYRLDGIKKINKM